MKEPEGPRQGNEDAFELLSEVRDHVVSPHSGINGGTMQQIRETKDLVQHALEVGDRRLKGTKNSLVLYMSALAIIALASAGIWVGVAGVALVLALSRWRARSARKRASHFKRFRIKFRELLAGHHVSDLLPEDEAFLREHEDSVLFPLAVPKDSRQSVGPVDLERIEALYSEYCGRGHLHSLPEEDCKLCRVAKRVREQVGGAIGKFDAAVESARQTLTMSIDGSTPQGAVRVKDFLGIYQSWERWHHSEPEASWLKSLCDKECWTFAEADRVRELCRDSNQLLHDLTCAMEDAAARFGLGEKWGWYGRARSHFRADVWLAEVRRAIGRRSPDAMFFEIRDKAYFGEEILQFVANWGYDYRAVWRGTSVWGKLRVRTTSDWREAKAAWKLLKEWDEKC